MKVRVGVFFGGKSVEHEISIISANQVMHAMDRNKYEVFPIYIAKDGSLYTGNVLFDISNYKDLNKVISQCTQVTFYHSDGTVFTAATEARMFGKRLIQPIDVAFLVMHGTYGEDGTLQGYLEILGLPYTGPDVIASALGMDKVIMKKVLKESGLPVLDYTWFYSRDWFADREGLMAKVESQVSYPMIVKPSNLGSSIGVGKAVDRNELAIAIDVAVRYAHKVLVETLITDLMEINCSVLGDYEQAEPSVCEEPLSTDEILSYQDKYMTDSAKGMSGSKRRVPAGISEDMTCHIQELAVKTFQALGCSGVSRVDFLVEKGSGKVYVNEINTIPGSLSFYLWQETGKGFSQLIDELIRLALKKHREAQSLISSYETNVLAQTAVGTKGTKV